MKTVLDTEDSLYVTMKNRLTMTVYTGIDNILFDIEVTPDGIAIEKKDIFPTGIVHSITRIPTRADK